jgi:hypothetical protein
MGAPALHVVSNTRPEAPYPADTLARGWRFELDLERIDASETWAEAPPELRPWLLMLWAASWRSIPVGTYPHNDRAIAGRIGMPLTMFQTHRETLMRGWILHADGLLYHPVITERVIALLHVRQGTGKRVADWRAKHVSNALRTRNKRVITPPIPNTEEGKDLPVSANADTGGNAARRPGPPDCPYERIVALYHETLPTLRAVAMLSRTRKTLIRARWVQLWEERGKRGKPNDADTLVSRFGDIFTDVAASKFLMGQTAPTPGRKVFTADLAWIMHPENFVKIIEGKYADE